MPFFKPGKEIKSLLAGTVTRRLFGDERRKSAAADLASLRHFGAGFEKNPEKRIRKEDVRRLSEQLMPLFDRANRMAIRNLKAIKELRQGLVPAIAIGRAEHVTVTRPQNGRGIRPVNPTLPAVKM